MESDLILIARAIDEKIKYIESKLEKPYLIGFNHNNEPAQEAEKIVNNLMKEMDEMVEEQQEISKLLEDEIKELEASNQDYKKFLTDGQSQLDECETYACNNLPGYKKYVPPSPPRDVPTDPSELPDIFTSPAPPNDQGEFLYIFSYFNECETYACNNLPGYKKYVPPSPPRDVPTDPSELPDIFTSPAPPNDQGEFLYNFSYSYECETYACNNLPGYKKYVPPSPPRDVPTDPSELPDIFTSPAPPNDQVIRIL
ncbi:uncharacterized protein LOC103508556 [Diaphorina citri]|uniref:Uncharacterized protein LOC103508556 n=1 Tax=Diaphorina citri TaxID=121845 RepID=A0A1S4EB09_DIACI|nr:uncharacterized protein LOC103508556 [Diaphorina citri]